MRVLRFCTLLVSIAVIMLIQACGGAGGSTDTAGALTMTAITATDNLDGTYAVSTTVTYAPPAGKSAQGIVITTTASDNFGVVGSDNATLTSGSNQVTYTFTVNQLVGLTNHVSIAANIGGMTASVGTVIPAISPISAASIVFLAAEGAVAGGTTKTTTISGGVGAYTLISPVTVDGVLLVSLADKVLSVKYDAGALVGTATSTLIRIQDVSGSTYDIPVSYFIAP